MKIEEERSVRGPRRDEAKRPDHDLQQGDEGRQIQHRGRDGTAISGGAQSKQRPRDQAADHLHALEEAEQSIRAHREPDPE